MKYFWFLMFLLSLFVNISLAFQLSLYAKVSESYGVLKQDVEVGIFDVADTEKTLLFKLPKGLTVKNASDVNQISQFEPYRFSIIVTSDEELVDYKVSPDNPYNDFYSVK